MGDHHTDPPVCEACNEPYTMETGHEPTPYCDGCVHGAVDDLRAQLAEGAKRAARASRVIAKLWEQRGSEERYERLYEYAWHLANALDEARAELAKLRPRQPAPTFTGLVERVGELPQTGLATAEVSDGQGRELRPVTGAEFLDRMQAVVEPVSDDELNEIIADLERR